MSLQYELKQLHSEIDGHKDAREVLDTCIADKIDRITEIEQQIADAEVIYSVGDRFTMDCSRSRKFILSRDNRDGERVALIGLANGVNYNTFSKVKDARNIKSRELASVILTIGDFTRYWDARKQERC